MKLKTTRMTLKENLKPYRLILASKSPRRQEILKQMGLDFEVQIRSVNEVFPKELMGIDIPIYLAQLKAEAFDQHLESNDILITSDTIVWCDDSYMGKPKDFSDAKRLLKKLSGKAHEVNTAECIRTADSQSVVVDTTKVHFRVLKDQDIEQYIDEFQPFDKAGSYGVQDWIGLVAIHKIEGSYFNVMGFPSHLVYSELEKVVSQLNLKNQYV